MTDDATGHGTVPADRAAPAEGTAPGPASGPSAGPAHVPAAGPAHVHVVRGTPDDVELAALVAGLAAVAVDHADGDAVPRGAWSDRARVLRGPRAAAGPGPDAWRWSLRG